MTNLMEMGLQAQAAALAAEKRIKKVPVLEIDAELTFHGRSFPVSLQVFGRYHAAHPGQSGGRGELRVSPPEPAHFEIDAVSLDNGHFVVDLDPVLSADCLEAIAEVAMEEGE